MSTIPQFDAAEAWVVRATLEQFHDDPVEPELAEIQVQLSPRPGPLTTCPALYWSLEDCHFVVFKTAPNRYRCQFFHHVEEQYGTGTDEYDDLSSCVTTLLEVHAEHDLYRRDDDDEEP